MTAEDVVPREPGARDTTPLDTAVGRRPGGEIPRRAAFVSLLIMMVALPAILPRLDAESGHPGTEVAVADSAVRTWSQKTPDALQQLTANGVRTVILGMRSTGAAVADGQLSELDATQVARLGLTKKVPAHGEGVWLGSAVDDPSGTWQAMVSMLRSRVRVAPGERMTAVGVKQGQHFRGVVRWDTSARWRDVPVGYDGRRIRELTRAGVRVVPAIGVVAAQPAWLASAVQGAQRLASTNRFLLTGGSPLADPVAGKQAASLLTVGGSEVLMGDFLTDQQRDGVAPFVEAASGQVIRVHWVPLYRASSTPGLVTRGKRATKERGVRMVAVRVGMPAPTLAQGMDILRGWQGDLPTSPFAANPAPARVADPLPALDEGFLQRGSGLLACFMVTALAIYLLTETRLYVRGRRWRVLARPLAALAYCALAIGAAFAWLTNNADFISVLIFLAAVGGAWSAVTAASAGLGRPPLPGRFGSAREWAGTVLRFCVAAVVVVAAGTAIAAAAAKPEYLLGVRDFRGVKLLLLLPLAGVAISGIAQLRVDRAAEGRAATLDSRVRWVLLAGVVVVVAGVIAVYLVRSGNSNTASSGELLIRDRLDDWLYVRPRFKELLIGYPALVLALRWPGAFGRYGLLVVAAIATTGTIDSFAHFHTPYWASVLRTGYAMAGGLLLGVVASLLLVRTLPWVVVRVRALVETDDATR